MDGTRYVDGVLIDQTQLSRTEASKAFQILRHRLDNWETGIHSGLVLTVNPVNQQRVDLSAGTGYAPDGEYVEVVADQLNIPMADNALGATNWVVAFYTELLTSPNPHETNGTLQMTERARGIRIRVLTPTQFAALPLTDPTYASDARDRGTLIGIVTATGGALSQTNILQPSVWRGLKYATMGTPPMGGVNIIVVSDTTPDGAGNLKFEMGPNKLSWQAPSEVGYGVATVVPNDGVYTLTALGGTTIQVAVVVAALPVSMTISPVTIRGVYTQDVPRMSGTDRHHRSLVGSGIPNPRNPHGLSIDDIAPGFIDELTIHQQMMHANGIWRSSNPNCLKVQIDELVTPDYLTVVSPAGVDNYWVDGKRLTAIGNTEVRFEDITTQTKGLFEIYVDNVGNVLKHYRLDHPVTVGTGISGIENGIVYVNEYVLPGAHLVTWTSLGIGAGGYLAWDGLSTPTTVPPGTQRGLFVLRNGKQEVWFWIGENMPFLPGTYQDTVTIYAAPDRTKYMPIAQVYWNGMASGGLGYTPQRNTVPAKHVDTRQFGTIAPGQLRDDALAELIWAPTAEHTPSGVAIGRIDTNVEFGSLFVNMPPPASLTCTITGQAPVYVAGRRYIVGSWSSIPTVTVPNNELTVVYVDVDGNIAQTNFVWAAFLWTNYYGGVNSTKYYPLSGVTHPFVYEGAALALVVSNAGNVVQIVDMRRNLSGGNVHVQPWTVGTCPTDPYPPTDLGVEFFNLNAAIVYAMIQGQQHLDCLNATLFSPGTAPISIAAGRQLSLSGSLSIKGDWSILPSVFRVIGPGELIFDHADIIVDADFIGATTTALVDCIAGSYSQIVFRNTRISVGDVDFGSIAKFAGSSLQGSLQIDKLLLTNTRSIPRLFELQSASAHVDGLEDRGPAGYVFYQSNTSPLMTIEATNVRATQVSTVYNGGASSFVTDSNFFGLVCQDFMSGTGTLINCNLTNCMFGGGLAIPKALGSLNLVGCSVSDNLTIGSSSVIVPNVLASGVKVDGTAYFNVSGSSVSDCSFGSVGGSLSNSKVANCSSGLMTFGVLFGSTPISEVSITGTKSTTTALSGSSVTIAGCQFGDLSLAGSDIAISGSLLGSITQLGSQLTNFKIVGSQFGLFQHNVAYDLTKLKIEGCTFTHAHILRDSELVYDIVVSGSTLNSVEVRCSVAETGAYDLGLLVSNNEFEQTDSSYCIKLSGHKGVHIESNRFSNCYARLLLAPIIIGGTDSDMHYFGDINIVNNSFVIDHSTVSFTGTASPIIFIGHCFSGTTILYEGIRVDGNTFTARDSNAGLISCVILSMPNFYNISCSGNCLSLLTYLGPYDWNVTSTPIYDPKDAYRLGLLLGYEQYPTVSLESTTYSAVSVCHNRFMVDPVPSETTDKWMCYYIGTNGFIANTASLKVMGNVSKIGTMWACPNGTRYTDPLLIDYWPVLLNDNLLPLPTG